jgi:hypothetical protein
MYCTAQRDAVMIASDARQRCQQVRDVVGFQDGVRQFLNAQTARRCLCVAFHVQSRNHGARRMQGRCAEFRLDGGAFELADAANPGTYRTRRRAVEAK